MRKISFPLLFATVLIFSVSSGTNLLSQDFNSSWSTQNPPPGWTIVYSTPVGNSDWHRRQAQTPWSDNSTGFACLYSTPQETGEDILISPLVNCSSYTNVVLRCSTFFIPQEGSAYIAKLQGSSDGGANWIDLYNYFGQSVNPILQVFDCAWANNKKEVKFRWYWSGNTNQLYHWSIDNITLTAEPIILDVGVTQIIEPTGAIDSGTVVTPKARVKNFGNVSVVSPVIFNIGGFYADQKYASVNPGESTVVNFANWTAVQVGTHSTKCSTALTGDANSNNNSLSGSVLVQVKDVGVTQIIVPNDTMDTVGPIMPQVRIKNYGSNSETFSVSFKIGTAYFQTRNKTIPARLEDTVNFPVWNAVPGTYLTRCSTYLAGDINPSNNVMSGMTVIRIRDIGVIQIIAPSGVLDSTGPITPQVRVCNNGTEIETFTTTFKIGSVYTQNRTKTLSPGVTDTINFPNWTPTRGTFVTRCSTFLFRDRNPGNDTLSGSVTVQVKDIGITEIVVPQGIVDSTDLIYPQVLVRNYGTNIQTFNVTFKIGTGYFDMRTKTIPAGVLDTVNFAGWVPIRGTYSTRCSTYLAGDVNPNNDTISGSFTISVLDVGVVEIIAPKGVIDSGTTLIPRVRVTNFGTEAVLFPISLQIGSWVQTRYKTLLAGQTDTVGFPQWTAQTAGWYMVKCSTALTGDLVSANDWLIDSILVRVLDVGVVNIVAPGRIVTPDTIMPQAWIKNYGTCPSGSFDVKFEILPGYADTFNIFNLAVGESLLVSFAPWVDSCGSYTLKCSTMLVLDCNSSNDYKTGNVLVSISGGNPGFWVELPKPIPGSQPLKDGSCLEVISDTLLFVLKGNKTLEFYRLNTKRDTWTKMANVPTGPENKLVKKGAKMTSDGERYIYLAKGGNTLEFYRYDVENDTWQPLPNIPLGGGKKVKDGTAMTFAEKFGESFVYLLKGVKTQEFYRFRIGADTWEKMPDAPAGTLKPGFKKGTDITFDKDNKIIYCLKDRTNEIFAYDVWGDTWLKKHLNSMPLIHLLSGKKKKVKDGAALCLVNSENIYALKGGNTGEFWLFKPLETDSGKWFGLALLPAIGADGKKKRVKDGGDLVSGTYLNEKALLVIKGNKTDKLWKWTDSLVKSAAPQLDKNLELNSIQSENTALKILPKLQIRPNPVHQNALLQLVLPESESGEITITLYNVIGQECFKRTVKLDNSATTIIIETKNLTTGAYILKVSNKNIPFTQKIIIAH